MNRACLDVDALVEPAKTKMQRKMIQRLTRTRSAMMLRALPLLAVLLFAHTGIGATFTATLDRDTVQVGETTLLRLTADAQTGFPAPPQIQNLQVGAIGNSQQFTVVNGQASAVFVQTIELTPLQPGEYAIPPLTARLNGVSVSSQPLKLTAVRGEVDDQLAFFKLFLPKTNAYVNEVITVQLQLYVRDGVANADSLLGSFEGLNASPLRTEGFSVLKTARAQRRRIQIGNSAYNVGTLVTALSPVKSGELTIDSISISASLHLPLPSRRRDFDPFGIFQQYQERRITLVADTVRLVIDRVPAHNAPEAFSGAVGVFAMNVTAAPTNIAAGDPITVRVEITGRGALDSLSLPDQGWQNFKSYPPTAKIDTSDPLGIEGVKTFEQVVVPQSTDIRELPALAFAYFDPDRKQFEQLMHPPIPLTVRPGGSVTAPATFGPGHSESIPPAQEFAPIKQRIGGIAQIAPPLIMTPWFLALQAAPVIGLIIAVAWRRRSESFDSNPKFRRRREVLRLLRDGVASLKRLAQENNPDAFFSTLFRLLQEVLGEHLDLPASAITEAVIDERLRPAGIGDQELSQLHDLFQLCDQARFAPVKSSQELAAIVPAFETVVSHLHRSRS